MFLGTVLCQKKILSHGVCLKYVDKNTKVKNIWLQYWLMHPVRLIDIIGQKKMMIRYY